MTYSNPLKNTPKCFLKFSEACPIESVVLMYSNIGNGNKKSSYVCYGTRIVANKSVLIKSKAVNQPNERENTE